MSSSRRDPRPGAATDDLFSSGSPQATGSGAIFGGRDELWQPSSLDDAGAAVTDANAFCQTKCPIFDRCAGDRCHVYRVEQRAAAFLREQAADPAGKLGLMETLGPI